MSKVDTFFYGCLMGLIIAIIEVAIAKPWPTVQQCETILNKNPDMCLSVCVEQFEKMGC